MADTEDATRRGRDMTALEEAGGGKPNFLWIYTEDNNPYIGAHVDPVAQTPNIDRLAQEGILYDVAYCSSPTCAPSPFAYLTGIYPPAAGPAQHMRALATLPSHINGFPELLRARRLLHDHAPLCGTSECSTRQSYAFGVRDRMGERYDLQRSVRDERSSTSATTCPTDRTASTSATCGSRPPTRCGSRRMSGERSTPSRTGSGTTSPTKSSTTSPATRTRSTTSSIRPRAERHAGDSGAPSTNTSSPPTTTDSSPKAIPWRDTTRAAPLAPIRSSLSCTSRTLRPGAAAQTSTACSTISFTPTTSSDTGPPKASSCSGEKARDDALHVAEAFRAETSDVVKIPLAEALARLGHTRLSVHYLAETLDTHPHPRVRLQAINALTYVGVAALPHKDVVERTAESADPYLRAVGRYLSFVLNGTYTPASAVFDGFRPEVLDATSASGARRRTT